MSSLKTRLEGIFLIILALTACFTPSLLVSRVIAQGGDYEVFLNRLEEYLRDALPAESDPVKECEYIVPEGFDASQAERLWRVFASNVSTGCSEQDFRRELGRIYPNGTITLDVNGSPAMLNLTGLRVEKPDDGSVRVKIPLESSVPLNYTYFNSTSVKVMYEAWNETLVRLYEVERYTGLYRYVMKNVEKNVVFDIVSRLTVGFFPEEMSVGRIMVAYPEKDWPWFLGNPIIAVPGHYEDVRIRVQEHEENITVLFPGYDPVFAEGWIVTTSVSSTSLTLGETLEVCYEAGYSGLGQPEPLNATLTITATEGLEPLDSVERILKDTHTSGVFRLRAVKPGLQNVTLFLEGNAYLSTWSPSNNVSYSILVVWPASPSVNIQVLNVDPSVMKHAGLTLELSNTGGSAARSVSIHVTGVHAEPTDMSIGDIDVGGSKMVELNIRLTRSSTDVTIRASYRDDEGNNYFSEAKTWVWTRSIWVPEHFEEIKVVVPEHEETVRVFVPDSNHFTHVRFYTLTFSYPGSGMVASMPTFQGHYGGFELVSRLKPMGEKEANGSSVETVANVDFILLSIEPYWENLGVYEEDEAAGLLKVDPAVLRAKGSLEGYRARLVKQFWRTSGSIVMNATQFAIYNETLSNHIARSSLQGEFILRWRKITNATRLTQPAGEKGFLTLIYRPLTVRGSGPLQTIQVRNYAGFNASYVLRVQQFRHQAYQNYPPVMDVYSSPLLVKSWDYNVTLAGLNTREGYTYLVSLMYGLNLVAQAVFSLNPEPSPFWTGFWDGIKGKLTGILVTSTIIIVTAVLTGGGTVAGCVGAGLSIAATLSHLIGGSIVNIQEFNQGWNTVMLLSSLADFYGNLSYRLSNYTPPKMEPTMPYVPPPIVEEFQPKGPLAELFWETSKEYRRAASKVLADTGLNIVLDVGISDFETALNPEAKEYDKGLACGRIVGTVLSVLGFMAATRIAAELRPKMEGFRANMWSAVGSLKAWITFALYDLVETLVKGGRTIAWIVKNHGVTLGFARLTVLGTLEKLKGRELEIWRRIRGEVKNAVEEAESKTSEEDCRRVLEEKALEKMEAGGGLGGKLTEAAGRTDQEKAVELFYRLDEAGLSLEERTRILDELNTIAGKSREAASSVAEWLKQLETEKLKEILDTGLLSEVKELEANGLKSLQVALEDPGRLAELVTQPELVSEAIGKLREAKYYEFQNRKLSGGSIWLPPSTPVDEGLYRVRAEVEGEPSVKMWTIEVRKEGGTNQITVPSDLRDELAGKTIKLEICGYVPEIHFPKHFVLWHLGEDVFLNFVEEKLRIGDFKIEKSKFGETVRSPQYGFGLTVETDIKSIERGTLLSLRFYEKGIVEYVGEWESGGGIYQIEEASLETKQLGDERIASLKLNIKTKEGETWESIYPIKTLELKVGEKYPMDFFVGNKDRTTGLQSEVRKIFGFDAVNDIQKKMEAGKIRAKIVFDDGSSSDTSITQLAVRTGGAQRVVEIMFYEPILKPLFTIEEAVEHFRNLGIKNDDLVVDLADRYSGVLGYELKDIEERGDDNLKGLFGELQIVERYAKKLKDIQYRVKVDGKTNWLDIVLEDILVESKYWPSRRTYDLHFEDQKGFEEFVKEIKAYREARTQLNKDKVYIVFHKKGVISDDKFNDYMQRLRDALGGDTSWLIICNGFDEFIRAYEGG